MRRGAGQPFVPCVGAIVHDAQGRLLMVRRATPPQAGRWTLPGGRLEQGEDDGAAIVRELVEETGLQVEVGALVGQVERPAPDGGTYIIRDYACQVLAGVLRAGDDAAEAAWVDAATFARLPLVDELAETLQAWGVTPRA